MLNTIRSSSRRVALACSFLISLSLVACDAGAATIPDCVQKDVWRRYDTRHFTLFSNAPSDLARDYARHLEWLSWTMDRRHADLRDESETRIIVYAFADKGCFKPFRPIYEGKSVEIVGMFLGGGRERVFIFRADGKPEDRRVVAHEYLHAFVASRFAGVPLCLNEGMAELISTFAVSGERAEYAHPIPEYRWVLEQEDPVPTDKLFEMRHDKEYYEGPNRHLFYAQSWAVVHYLLTGPHRSGFDRFLHLLNDGVPARSAFAKAFPEESWDELTLRARKHAVDTDAYLSLALGTAPGEVAISESAPPRQDIYAALGDLLLHQGRHQPDQAELFYDAALALDPTHGPSLAGLGAIADARGYPVEASKLFARAAASPSADSRACLRAARASLARLAADSTASFGEGTRMPQAVSEARTYVQRGLSLEPTNADALGLLGHLLLGDSAYAVAAVPLLERAHEELPRRRDICAALVRAYVLADRLPDADRVFTEKLEHHRNDEAAREALDALLQASLREAHRLLREGHADSAFSREFGIEPATRKCEIMLKNKSYRSNASMRITMRSRTTTSVSRLQTRESSRRRWSISRSSIGRQLILSLLLPQEGESRRFEPEWGSGNDS